MQNTKKLIDKSNVLAKVIEKISDIYFEDTCNEDQKQLIETMIGAAIWYLPQSKDLWTGKISLEALREHHPESKILSPKLTADHLYPRKIAAMELLEKEWGEYELPGDELLKNYINKYGRFNYITPSENRKLVKFQKKAVFKDVEEAYSLANIKLISITKKQLKLIEARDIDTITELLISD